MSAEQTLQADYLVVGSGAVGMAFADTIASESESTVVIVDRLESPGGHWTSAYPFVRLHQPAAYYGVNSRDLGTGRLEDNGDNAGLYAPDEGWSPGQRQKVEDGVRHAYSIFKQRVAEGRGLPYDGLDEIANGRVWTGKQAQAHGLVDALGDFQVALDLACEAAGLPTDGSVGTEVGMENVVGSDTVGSNVDEVEDVVVVDRAAPVASASTADDTAPVPPLMWPAVSVPAWAVSHALVEAPMVVASQPPSRSMLPSRRRTQFSPIWPALPPSRPGGGTRR